MKTTAKRIFSMIVCLTLLICSMPVSAFTNSNGEPDDIVVNGTEQSEPVSETVTWNGTSFDTSWYSDEETQFVLDNADKLAGFTKLVNLNGKSFEGKYVSLSVNIDWAGNSWVPIGSDPLHPFKGTFDGNHNIISNVNIVDNDNIKENQYMVIETPMTWEEARAFCVPLGGHLVTINSAQEQEQVSKLLPEEHRWIGAKRAETDVNSWVWVNGESFTYSNWASGEPNNTNGIEHYAHINIDQEWNDLPSTSQYPFICEFEPTSYIGIFGYADNATIKQVGINSYTIDVDYNDDCIVGGLVAYAYNCTIKDCYTDGDIDATYKFVNPLNRNDVITYSHINDVPSSLNTGNYHGQGIIIDLTSSPAELNKTITISGDVSAIKFIGDLNKQYTGLNIVIGDSNYYNLYMELENFKFTGSDTKGTIYGTANRSVYIISSGYENKVCGVRNGVAIGLNFSNLYISGDAVMTIIGGNGVNGTNGLETGASGSSGNNGSGALIADSLIIDGTVYAIGGDGGNGGNGVAGNNVNASESDQRPTAGRGGYGGNGGNGASAIYCTSSIIVVGGTLTARSGNGGSGGSGGNGGYGIYNGLYRAYAGNGGRGGQGGNGGNSNSRPVSASKYNVQSDAYLYSIIGNGGNGGAGGDGGAGASSVAESGAKAWPTNWTISDIKGANGGAGGDGGNGGNAGAGATSGSIGKGGLAGNGGAKGHCYYHWTTWVQDFLWWGHDVDHYEMQTGSDGANGIAGCCGNINNVSGTNLKNTSVFFTGVNNLASVYQNRDAGVTVDVRNAQSDNPSGLPYELRIVSKLGASNWHLGGYTHNSMSAANKTFYYTILAKIPIGYNIGMFSNSLGEGSSTKWLTDNSGTGTWKWYIGETTCGISGNFSTLGFVALTGGDGVTDNIEWRVGYTNLVDGTNISGKPNCELFHSVGIFDNRIGNIVADGYINTQVYSSNLNLSTASYDNTGAGVSVSTVSGSQSNPLHSNYELKIMSKSGSDGRHYGGYQNSFKGKAGGTYYWTVFAKVPVGCSLGFYTNSLGDGGETSFISDVNGTGDWKWYFGKTTYGNTGTISSIGFIAINGDAEIAQTTPWYVAYSNIVAATDENYIHPNETTFADSQYTFVYGDYTWDEAEAICESLGGHLVTIASDEEQTAVAGLFSGVKRNFYTWIGAKRFRANENQWAWITGETFEYANWEDNQPDNAQGVEDFAHFYGDGKWNDWTADKRLSFICEFDSEQLSSVYNYKLTKSAILIGGLVGCAQGGSVSACSTENYSINCTDINTNNTGSVGTLLGFSNTDVQSSVSVKKAEYKDELSDDVYQYTENDAPMVGSGNSVPRSYIGLLNTDSKDEQGILYSVKKDKNNVIIKYEVCVGETSADSKDSDGRYTGDLANNVSNSSEFNGEDAYIPDYVFTGTFMHKVTEISRYAFYKSNVVNAYIGKNVEYIYDASFRECGRLKAIYVDPLNETYKNLDDGSKEYTGDNYYSTSPSGSVLYKTTASGDFTLNENIIEAAKEISIDVLVLVLAPQKGEYSAFDLSKCPNVYGINDYAFYDTDLTSIDLSYITIVGKNAFESSQLQQVNGEGKRGTIELCDYAFFGCSSLSTFSSALNISGIGSQAFYGCTGKGFTSFNISMSTIHIGKEAFGGCINLERILVNEANTFYTNVNNDGVLYRYVGTNLNLVQYPMGRQNEFFSVPENVITIELAAFANSQKLVTVEIKNSVRWIQAEAFKNCKELKKVDIGAEVISIDSHVNGESWITSSSHATNVFEGCLKLESVNVDKDNNRYFNNNNDGVLYEQFNDNEINLICYPSAKQAVSYDVMDGTILVAQNAFYSNRAIVQLHLPASVEEIETGAVNKNMELLGIYFYSEATTVHIAANAFNENNVMMSLYYPESAIKSWSDVYVNSGNSTTAGLNFSAYGKVCGISDGSVANTSNPYIIAVYDVDGNPLGEAIEVQIDIFNSDEHVNSIVRNVVVGVALVDLKIEDDYTYSVSIQDETGKYNGFANPDFHPDTMTPFSAFTLAQKPVLNGLSVVGYGSDEEHDIVSREKDITTDKVSINTKVYNDNVKITVSCSKSEVYTTTQYTIMQSGILFKQFTKVDNEWVITADVCTSEEKNHKHTSPTFEEDTQTGIVTIIIPSSEFIEEAELTMSAVVEFNNDVLTSDICPLNINIVRFDESIVDDWILKNIDWGFGEDLIKFLLEADSSFSSDIADKLLSSITLDIKFSLAGDKVTISFGKTEKIDDIDSDKKGEMKFNPKKGWFNKSNTETSVSSKLSWSIMGKLELRYYDGIFHLYSGGLTGSVSFSKEFTLGTFMIWVIPLRLSMELSTSGELSINILFDENGSVPVFDSLEIGIKVKGGVTFMAGIGCKAVSAGVYGSAELVFSFKVTIPDGDGEIRLDLILSAGIYAKVKIGFLEYKYEKELAKVTLGIGGYWDEEGLHFKNIAEAEKAVLRMAQASAYELQPSPVLLNTVQSDHNEYDDNFAPQIVSYIDASEQQRVVMFYIANVLNYCNSDNNVCVYNGQVYDEYNYSKLLYSEYDFENNCWGLVNVVDNNGYSDGEFSVVAEQGAIYIAYTQLNELLTMQVESANDALKYFDVKASIISNDTINIYTVFNDSKESSSFDSQPTAYINDGIFEILWLNIPSNDLLGLTKEHNVSLYRSVVTPEGNISNDILISNSDSIIAYSYVNKEVATLVDMDGIMYDEESGFSSCDDRIIKVIDTNDNTTTFTSFQGNYSNLNTDGNKFIVQIDNSYIDVKTLYKDEQDTLTGTSIITSDSVALNSEFLVECESESPSTMLFTSVSGENLDSSNLYVVFKQNNQWGKPIQITETEQGEYIESYACEYLADGACLIATFNGSYLDTKLHYFDSSYDVDALNVKQINYNNDNITIEFELTNTGRYTIDEIIVEIKNKSTHEVIADVELTSDVNILSGDTKTICFTIQGGAILPNDLIDGFDRTLQFTINEVKKECDIRVGYADLSIKSKTVVIGGCQYVILYVMNCGNIIATCPKILITNSNAAMYGINKEEDYAYIHTSTFYSMDNKIEPGEVAFINIKADQEFCNKVFADGAVTEGIVNVAILSDTVDINEENNTTTETVIALSELQTYTFDKSNENKTDLNVYIPLVDGVAITSVVDALTGDVNNNCNINSSTISFEYDYLRSLPEGQYIMTILMDDNTNMSINIEITSFYDITWIIDEETESKTTTQIYEYGNNPKYDGKLDIPSSSQHKYTFIGWRDINGTLYLPGERLPEVSSNMVYTAEYVATLREYTVTWNVDGVETKQIYQYGDIPVYSNIDIIKTQDKQYSYEFIGWDHNIIPVQGNITYVAKFKETLREYEITWAVDDRSTVQCYVYGSMPSSSGVNVSKAPDEQYTYSFDGWDKEIQAVTSNVTYTAKYSKCLNTYIVTWNIDGVPHDEIYEYGTIPQYNDVIKKTADSQYTYTFYQWDKDISPVTQNVTYDAVFSKTVNYYSITWVIDKSESVTQWPYGSTPVYDGEVKKEPDEDFTYSFTGWDKDIETVTGNSTYEAVFEKREIIKNAVELTINGPEAVSVGEIITYNISVSNIKDPLGMEGLGIDKLEYNNASLNFISAQLTKKPTDSWKLSYNDNGNYLTLLAVDDNSDDIIKTPNELVISITFQVKSSSEAGGTVRLNVTDAEAVNGALESITVSTCMIESAIEQAKTLQLENDSIYTIDRTFNYLIGVVAETRISELVMNIANYETIIIRDGKGNIVVDTNGYIGTGYKVQLVNGGIILDEITVVIKGDVNGDGKINGTDYLRLRNYYLKTFDLTSSYLYAADTNGDNKVNGTDYLRVRNHFLGSFNLYI